MGDVFVAAPHDAILKLLIQLSVLLLTARVLGEFAQRMGQSSVVGEILAGILLGPSLLSGIFPVIEEWMVPQTAIEGYLLEEVSLLGILFLLLITGLETDIALIRKQARSALGAALGGLVLPLALGFGLGMMLPEYLLAQPDERTVFALFIAIAMAISAIPVIAKVLMDLKLTRRDVGQTIIAAAMIDDTTGWILLSVVIGLAGGQAVTVGGVAESIFSVLVFLGISFTVGQWVVARLLRYTQTSVISRDKVLTLVVILMLAFGAVTHALHFEALLGAFVVGILFSRLPGFDVVVVHRLESITLGVFAPIFFAVAGLKVDIISLLEPELIAISLALIGIATVSKLAGIYVGARVLGGSDHWSALFYGAGLNARGSMGIIVATIGLSLGVLSQDMFSIIVLMAVVTSLVAPAALRYTFANIQAGEAELDRLRREELNQDNLVANTHRALLAVRWRDADFDDDTQRVEARILERMSTRTDLEITLFNVAYTVEQQKRGMSFLDRLAGMFSQQQLGRKVVVGDDPMRKILDEAERDYDLLILGASRSNNSSTTLFNPIVDQLMRLTPSSTIVVSGGHVDADWRPRRVLIPTNGSQAARRAAEVAFAITEEDSMAIVLTVVQTRQSSDYRLRSETLEMNQIQIAGQIVAELRELGELLTVQTLSEVVQGTDVSEQILKVAENEAVDLIVLGTNIRAGSDRLYLGPKVEQVLRDAPCPVVVVNAR